MGEPRLQEVREIFAAALELQGGRRKSFLATRCAGAPGLRQEVEGMLASHRSLGAFLEKPLFGRAPLELAQRASLPPTLSPGECLGDFEIESFLASGGSGEVYRARQLSLGGRQVALKIQHVAHGSGRGSERFIREAQTASTIHQPHLVQVYDFGEEPDRGLLYYAMRLVEGPTLEQVLIGLAQAGVAPEEAIRHALVERFLEVARALAALHARGLVHRDVKPANIVLEGAGHACAWEQPAVLVDFGLVRPIEAEPTHSTRWATPPYSAPEVLLGGAIDARADVRSLGLIMHDLLAARLPEQRTRPHDAAPELLGKLVPGMDRDLEAIVAMAVVPEIQWRYADCRMLAGDLEAWLAGKPVSARKTRGLARLRRWVQRNPGKVLAWSARGLVLGLVALFLILGVQQGIRVVVAARDAEHAWDSGDFESLRSALPSIPTSIRRLLLPAELEGLLDEKLGPGGPLRSVYRILASDGDGAALLHAARFLERDGLQAHPKLAQFLLRSLDGSGVPLSELMLVARLFHERPAENPQELLASAPFTRRLREILEHEEDHSTVMYALMALSGCGRPRDLPAVLEWLEAKLLPGSPNESEAIRMALVCMKEIARRSRACALEGELLGLDFRDLLARTHELLEAQSHRSPGAGLRLMQMLLGFCRALVFTARAGGDSELVDFAAVFGRPWPRILAARGSAGLEEELRRGRGIFLDSAMPKGHQLLSRLVDYHEYGFLAGSYGSASLETELLALVRERAAMHGLSEEQCVEVFRCGVQKSHGERTGECAHQRPDPDTRLGAVLGRDEIAVVRPPIRSRDPRDNWSVAEWDFQPEVVETAGVETGLELSGVILLQDEWEPTAHFARLGLPGYSELRLSFSVPSKVDDGLMIRVYWQKGQRSLLPHGGSAGIEILLDGTKMTDVQMRGNSPRRVALPLARALAPRKHDVTLRPSLGSNTTLRIYSVSIGYR